ncbi:hypothetical protein RKD23_003655 [Streptomyces sp. SAI-170]|uniref:SCO2400 family protein n=1 Tax=Streptomyces sp. SAI-170 TaxID=3377729 RepID=UPI003C7AE535
MDYCSACRRHLNGALVCPGCGAYAPDIAPAAVPTPVTRLAPAPAPAPVPAEDAPPSTRPGRAARRRQLARLKKHKRRAAVATAVALVGGGLTLASLDRGTPARAQAAAAPDDRPMGGVDLQAPDHTPQPVSSPAATQRAPRPSVPAEAPAAPAEVTTPRVGVPVQRHAPAAAPQQRDIPQSSTVTTPRTPPPSTPTVEPTAPTAPEAPATQPPEASAPPTEPTEPTQPTGEQTDPAKVCLLVLCLG